MTSNEAVLKALKQTPNFRFFPEAGLLKLIEIGQILDIDKRDYISRENESGESFYIIISGCVDVSVFEEGREVYLCTLGEGEIVGETGIFPKMNRNDNVITMEDTRLLEVRQENFIKFMKDYQSASNQILLIVISCLIKKLQRSNKDLAFERKSGITQTAIDELINGVAE